MANLRTAVALHDAVRTEIARRVNAQDYEVGVPLPSAAALVREFGVSAITIKRALRDLQAAGTLRSVPGLGTFVREQRRFVRDLSRLPSLTDDAREAGFKMSSNLISVTQEKIKDPNFKHFSPPERFLLNVKKIILADGKPFAFDSVYICAPVTDEMIDEFGEDFVYEVLARNGHEIVSRRVLIDAAPASPEVQQIFSVMNGYPTLRRFYHLATADPSVALYGLVESPFDRLACIAELKLAPKEARS